MDMAAVEGGGVNDSGISGTRSPQWALTSGEMNLWPRSVEVGGDHGRAPRGICLAGVIGWLDAARVLLPAGAAFILSCSV